MTAELQHALFSLEERFWGSGPDFYRQHLAQGVLMVFPAPVGILAKDEVLDAVAQAPRWTSVRFEERWLVQINDATAIIAYKAVARREGDGASYVTFASSTYVREPDAWKLAFHQQTPDLGG
jgi:hypothetical protein